jgi:hypothetical protein
MHRVRRERRAARGHETEEHAAHRYDSGGAPRRAARRQVHFSATEWLVLGSLLCACSAVASLAALAYIELRRGAWRASA